VSSAAVESVVSSVAVEGVVSVAAVQGVVSSVAVEGVAIVAAVQGVVSSVAVQSVVAPVSVQGVATVAAVQSVVMLSPKELVFSILAVERVIAVAAANHIIATKAINSLVPVEAVNDIIPWCAMENVAPCCARKGDREAMASKIRGCCCLWDVCCQSPCEEDCCCCPAEEAGQLRLEKAMPLLTIIRITRDATTNIPLPFRLRACSDANTRDGPGDRARKGRLLNLSRTTVIPHKLCVTLCNLQPCDPRKNCATLHDGLLGTSDRVKQKIPGVWQLARILNWYFLVCCKRACGAQRGAGGRLGVCVCFS